MTITSSSTGASPHGAAADPVSTWWRHAVIYQVYIRSFADGNGDGTGDIAGLRSKLGYLRELGVDAIWINPWYPSPLLDGGYDVADYRDIDARFGTLSEAEALIAEAHDHGIRLIVDLVPNHTSFEHAWFRAALAAAPGSPERARYLFRPGRGDDGELPPNDWQSVFGGPAWTRVGTPADGDGEWYLHLFDHSQPDLNWENSDVLDEFDDILRFWLDRGVDGFRVDVAHAMVKDPALPDLGDTPRYIDRELVLDHPHWDRDGLHPIIRRWRAILDTYDDRMMVAEATVHSSRRPLYLRPDEYHQAFDFQLMHSDWDAGRMRAIIETAYGEATGVGSIPSWVLANHDKMRHPTRYGLPPGTKFEEWMVTGPFDLLDAELGLRRARAAAFLSLGLPGSAYVYQGEELGLPEAWDLPPEVLDDPVWEDSGHERKGRDGCRVPIPWEPTGPSLGFGDGSAEPWLPQPAEYVPLAASEQVGDESSTLELYRRLIRLRREHLSSDEHLELLELGPHLIAYRRGSGVVCVVNFGSDSIDLPAGEVLASSVDLVDGRLPSDAAAWIR